MIYLRTRRWEMSTDGRSEKTLCIHTHVMLIKIGKVPGLYMQCVLQSVSPCVYCGYKTLTMVHFTVLEVISVYILLCMYFCLHT